MAENSNIGFFKQSVINSYHDEKVIEFSPIIFDAFIKSVFKNFRVNELE